MLIKARTLHQIRDGQVDLLFRRWARARVKPGTMLTTALGIVEILAVTPVAETAVAHSDADRAGFAGLMEMRRDLAARPDGTLFCIDVRWAGEDPRPQLAADTALDGDTLAAPTEPAGEDGQADGQSRQAESVDQSHLVGHCTTTRRAGCGPGDPDWGGKRTPSNSMSSN